MADELFGSELEAELGSVSLELKRIEDLADGVARSMSNAFRGAVSDGRSLRTVLSDIARSFADIALKAAFRPIGEIAGGLVESLFSAANPAIGIKPFAKGGVVTRPTYFPTGQQLGLMGEAGPEAILPLRRSSDGRLGVAAAATGATSINFNVTATDARSFIASEAEISAMLLRAARRGTRAS
ncbi:tail protein [Devosia pacifica]|uniref:Tail protein n=1 Tax=Devosia pacifica TaxID=1335967 RepID=A0A918S9Y6_9HYPH|nr:phage tail tape measure protein [Devosia pacifica]GHA29304.1 tail protein [Devosia pacifica]